MNKPPRARVAAELTVPTREGLSIELNTTLVLVDLLGEHLIAFRTSCTCCEPSRRVHCTVCSKHART